MSKIQATIIKHSQCPKGHELITYELIFPRFLLSELNVHRMFSKNSASSRAIPFKKMVEMVQSNPFIPIAWQKEHKGMQGSEYWTDMDTPTRVSARNKVDELNQNWLSARDAQVGESLRLHSLGVTKQLCNRLLEPFMWHKVLLTTGKEGLENFFNLRCPEYSFGSSTDNPLVWKSRKDAIKDFPDWKDRNDFYWLSINKGQAEIHMMELAEQMYDAYNESVPQKLKEGEWHIPYDDDLLYKAAGVKGEGYTYKDIIKASTGLCARASYILVGDDKFPSLDTLIGIHDKMVAARPRHSSPMEHCSIVMSNEEYYLYSRGKDGSASHEHGWCRNFRGFIQYRELIEQSHQA